VTTATIPTPKINWNSAKFGNQKPGSDKFGYFVVFENNPISRALTLDEFLVRIKML